MVSHPISQAVVLATAALPARSSSGGRARLVARLKTGGLTQLQRTLLTLRKVGVRRFVVVLRADADAAALRQQIESDPRFLHSELVWLRVDAADDASAVIAAGHHVRGEYFLASVDRMFPVATLRRLLDEPLDGVTLAVSKQPPALQVALPTSSTVASPRVAAGDFGLTLARDRATGVGQGDDARFAGVLTSDDRLAAMLRARRSEGASTDQPELVAAIAELAAAGKVRVADIGDAYALALREPGDRRKAQRVLVKSLRKSVDGVIARLINRRFSLAVTSVLMHLPVRPNHVTAFSLMLALAASVTAALATAATPAWLIVGAVLWQLASMFDGVDGELARLKFTESKIGEWFDTITDDIGRITFFVGFGVGVSHVTGQGIWLQLALASVVMQFTLCVRAYAKMIRAGSGTHYALAWAPADDAGKASWAERVLNRIEFMARRDWYVFALLVMTVMGIATFALFITFLTTSLAIANEIMRPRQVRENFVLPPPVG